MIEPDSLLDDEQTRLSRVVRELADEVVAPAAYRYDTERRLLLEIVAQLGELGLFGLPFPRDVGGQGKDYVSLCVAVEALARVDQSIAVTPEAGVGLGIVPIYRHGTREQRERWLPDLLAGRALGAFGLTEAGAGSDAAATRTTCCEGSSRREAQVRRAQEREASRVSDPSSHEWERRFLETSNQPWK